MNKHPQKINIKKFIILILSIILIASILYIIKYISDTKKAKNMGGILENVQIDASQITEEKTERMLQLEGLQKENADIVAWIQIEGTNINYPVLQTNNNDYYLDRDYKKEYFVGGSLFLDKDASLTKPSTNFLIYGHRMKNGTMFEDLAKYKDESFYKEHPKIRFTTNNEDAEYEIIAAFYSRLYYKSEKNVFRYYFFIEANNEKEYNDFVNNAKKASEYDTGISANYGDQLLTLSTCSYHTEDGRFAVVARKLK